MKIKLNVSIKKNKQKLRCKDHLCLFKVVNFFVCLFREVLHMIAIKKFSKLSFNKNKEKLTKTLNTMLLLLDTMRMKVSIGLLGVVGACLGLSDLFFKWNRKIQLPRVMLCEETFATECWRAFTKIAIIHGTTFGLIGKSSMKITNFE